MPLILAIEPDRRQANQLNTMVRGQLHAELVLADTAEHALAKLGDRVPDLILTSALLSPKDEAALGERLRTLDNAAAHVQTLTIPVLASPQPRSGGGRGMFSVLLGDRGQSDAAPDGCDPAVFAEQCAEYLTRATAERAHVVVDEPLAQVIPQDTAPVATLATGKVATFVPEKTPAAEKAVEKTSAAENWDDAPDNIDPAIETFFDTPLAPVAPVAPVADTSQPRFIGLDDQAQRAIELDLSSLLDDDVVQELSAAIEHVTASERKPKTRSPKKARVETWTPIPIGNRPQWPRMEGTCAEVRRPVAVAPSVRVASKPKRSPKAKPAQDEWGFFDPSQCGFAALLAKLDEITDVAPALPADSSSAASPRVSR